MRNFLVRGVGLVATAIRNGLVDPNKISIEGGVQIPEDRLRQLRQDSSHLHDTLPKRVHESKQREGKLPGFNK